MPHLSESLAGAQAIRYLESSGLLTNNLGMETNAERRRRKLAVLATQKGGVEGIAEKTGLNPDSLLQVIRGVLLPRKKGEQERSPRGLGDSAARTIEGAFELGRGWFDNDEESVDMTSHELVLLGYFRQLDSTLQALVIENVKDAAERRQALAEQLAAAMKPKAPAGAPTPRK